MSDGLGCPLCNAENRCASALTKDADDVSECWCMTVTIPPALLAQVPRAQRNRSCICAACVAAYGLNPDPGPTAA
ncbi:cysteine-rich CWC family protein [Reinekea sp.]|jgi:hypothetical protein|uniref:cysteine-rich CWC family protein n=1 Tax=Reinekea sp. TaxID=1970455 RepID=UPI0039C421C1